MSHSLYEKIGGFGVVSRIVLRFYDKVLESELVSPYFASIDMKRLIDHQTQFICSLLGGPASFTDEQIRSAHHDARITTEAFDEIVELFEESLDETGLEQRDVATVLKLFKEKRPLVVANGN